MVAAYAPIGWLATRASYVLLGVGRERAAARDATFEDAVFEASKEMWFCDVAAESESMSVVWCSACVSRAEWRI